MDRRDFLYSAKISAIIDIVAAIQLYGGNGRPETLFKLDQAES
jgi:hypothetical protein